MQYITQKIENTIYSYDPAEFMPIWYEDKLANKSDFVRYKIKRLITR